MTIKRILTLIFSFSFLFSLPVYAQKGRKPVVKKPVYTIRAKEEPVTPGDRFFFVVTLDKDGNATTSVQNESGPVLSPALTAMFFKRLSRMGDTRLTSDARRALGPGVIIRPERSLKYGKLLEAVRAARDPSDLRVLVETDGEFYLGIPQKPDLKNPPRPNPVTLLLVLEDNELYINNEPHGSLSDPGDMENFLKRIFKDRADNGLFREGTNIVETTVFLHLPDDASVADLMKLVKMLRSAGSDTIGLDIDALEILTEIREVPRMKQ